MTDRSFHLFTHAVIYRVGRVQSRSPRSPCRAGPEVLCGRTLLMANNQPAPRPIIDHIDLHCVGQFSPRAHRVTCS